jgi:hypothetical protein
MNITLTQILNLVGKLDDTPGNDTPRERFRRYLKDNVKEVGQIRDYTEECLRNSGDQYNRALQDLVNHLATFLGFDVVFGRYHGVSGQIGFDGLWKSPKKFFIVAEVKTTEVYAIKTVALLGYVDALISEKKITNWNHALGLYIVGRPDAELRQLENSVIAEQRIRQLRIISVEALLSLAELMNEYDIDHDDILATLKPSGPSIDSIVDLMTRLVAQQLAKEKRTEEPQVTGVPPVQVEAQYWLTPVKGDEEQTAEEVIRTLVGKEKIYAFGERTPGRRHIKPTDRICFYATGKGVVAEAEVVSPSEHKHHPQVQHPDRYPWVFRVKNVRLYLDKPVIIDATLRGQLDAFQRKNPNQGWGWFVQATRKITKRDFGLLTRGR